MYEGPPWLQGHYLAGWYAVKIDVATQIYIGVSFTTLEPFIHKKGVPNMPNTNASFRPLSRTDRLEQQIKKLDDFMRDPVPSKELNAFDTETEQLLLNLSCQDGKWLESYKYAVLGEAEAIVNLPESAQQPGVRDNFKKSLQQRRQVLLGCVSYLVEAEALENKALRGEDREDPPK